jgi:L-2-hydroxyglutarate oxidase LhgO
MDVDVTVIGAGVVGLACAAELSCRHSILLLERNERVGQETSSRNSGVIHAGIYYPAGSLKAQTCVEGRRLLYERCLRHGIPHRRTGKLIVATDESEVEQLHEIEARAKDSGVSSLVWWSRRQLEKDEPNIKAVAALWSPESGIVDAHALMDSYRTDAEREGCQTAVMTTVIGLDPVTEGWKVTTRAAGGELFAVRTRWVVNAAGLGSDEVAKMAGIDIDEHGLRTSPCKGEYFALSNRAPRTRAALVYPVPGGPGLGIHLTTDLGGRRVAGPNAHYVSSIDYSVDGEHHEEFYLAVRSYLPGLEREDLTPDYAGIRPKLGGASKGFVDFALVDGEDVGAPASIHLLGIESPGLTAAGALARRVASMIG